MASSNDGKTVLGLGLVGLGGATLSMLPKFVTNTGFLVVAAADVDQKVLGAFSKDHPDAATYSSIEELCKDSAVDLVYIATPNRFHSEHTIVAFESGKHVLIEKPMTIEIPGSIAMVEAAEKAGVLLGVNVKHSFEPRVRKVREMVRTQEFGKLRLIKN
jgi:phthalate 4,5-cis-dihydrodiol dehydrogenase